VRIQYDKSKAGRVYRPMRDQFWKPVVRDGLLLHMPFRRGTIPQFSAAEATGLATEGVDADGTRRRWEEDGFIEQALANTARITPDGVLVEGARTNVCLRSDEFDNADSWTISGGAADITITEDEAVIAPDGGSSWKFQSNVDVSDAVQQICGGFTDGAIATASVYARAGTAAEFRLALWDASGGTVFRADVTFEWTAGVLSVKTEAVGTGGVEALPGGWYRAWAVSATNITEANSNRIQIWANSASDEAYQYFWGAQAETGAFPSSYIPTVAAAVTRAADDLQIDNIAEAHIQAAAGTILIAATPQVDGGDLTAEAYLLEAYGGSGAQVILSVKTDGKYRAPLWNGSATVCDLASDTLSVKGVTNVVAVSWEDANYRLYVDGSEEDNDTTGDMASTVGTPIYIGRNAAGAKHAFSKMDHLLTYNRPLTAGEMLVQSDQIAAWVAG